MKKRRTLLKQRLIGIATLAMIVPLVIATDGDATAAFFMLLIGIPLTFSKKVIIFED